MTNNELQRMGWNITRTWLKILPKDFSGDILQKATEHIENYKPLSELLKRDSNNINEIKVGMSTAVRDYISLKK